MTPKQWVASDGRPLSDVLIKKPFGPSRSRGRDKSRALKPSAAPLTFPSLIHGCAFSGIVDFQRVFFF